MASFRDGVHKYFVMSAGKPKGMDCDAFKTEHELALSFAWRGVAYDDFQTRIDKLEALKKGIDDHIQSAIDHEAEDQNDT
ncbi:MAG: hypothetical protein OEY11_15345 [Gammaproteobacteria bacterium]|nr:hypothetical protein [Gammaproteobacteria bacterium]